MTISLSEGLDKKYVQSKIRVVIADDHPIARRGFKNEITKHEDIDVVGEAINGNDALLVTRTILPDVLLLDVNMPGMPAIDVIAHIIQDEIGTKILVVSALNDLKDVFVMLNAGAKGYIVKRDEPSSIVDGIRAVAYGKRWLSPEIAIELTFTGIRIQYEGQVEELTIREREILNLVAEGRSNHQISNHLSISESTVKNHVYKIYDKLGVNTRAAAAAWAWQNGFVHSEMSLIA